jgi:HipA-like protein
VGKKLRAALDAPFVVHREHVHSGPSNRSEANNARPGEMKMFSPSVSPRIAPSSKRQSVMNRIRSLLKKGSREINMDVQTPSDSRASFHLRLGSLLVGVLSVADGHWTFRYADEFRRRPDLRPLPIFPELDKVYESEELWQFFRMRVPSLKQPSVREIVRREGLDSHDQIQLLRRFGRRTISNPFELVNV